MNNKWRITKEWIGYLKRNRIAELKPDEKTGKLIYIRQPKVEDLYKFLILSTDFEESSIITAIQSVLSRSNGQSQIDYKPQSGQQNTQQKSNQEKSNNRIPRLPKNTTDAVDQESDKKEIKEDIIDDPGQDISERDAELIFDILIQSNPSAVPSAPGRETTGDKQTDKNQTRDQTEDLKKIKDLIRTKLTPEQIMGLWRNLKNG